MTDADDLLTHERMAVARARRGDHDAFVELYRQDAAPAWRLALALTGEPARAADAVAEGFRRMLAPTVAAARVSEVPFQVRLLTATRHAVLDAATARTAPAAERAVPRTSAASAEAMAAFHQLPERWRAALWLLAVEGYGSAEVARVLDISATDAEDLAVRARDGLREQWRRDRDRAGGEAPAGAATDVARHLQPMVPLPLSLFALAEDRWRSSLGRPAQALHLVLPGGRPMPAWAERALIGATGLLIALGITGALLSDRETRSPLDDGLAAAGGGTDRGDAGDAGGSPNRGMPPEPAAYLDGAPTPADGSSTASGRSGTPRLLVTIDPTTGAISTRAVGEPTAARSPDPTTTTAPPPPPLLEVVVGTGPALGVSLGDRCTGVELGGSVLGCPPATADEGLTLEAESALLPGL